MLFTKKTVIIICIVAALVLGAIAGYVVYDLKLRGSGINVRDKALFDLDKSDVVSLTFISDINGETKELSVDDRDRIDDILSKLCSLTYSSVKKSGISDGNSAEHKLTVRSAQGTETWQLNTQTVKVTRISYGTEATVYTYYLTDESVPIMAEIIALMPGESDETADNRVFPLDDLESNPVEKIWLQSGNTGEYRSFDSAEDIEWFVSRLKALTCEYTHDDPGDNGWRYRIIVDRMYGDIDSIVSTLAARKDNEKGRRTVYILTPESKEIIKEIIALMPD